MKRGLKIGLLYLNDSETLQETCPKTAHANEDTKTLIYYFLIECTIPDLFKCLMAEYSVIPRISLRRLLIDICLNVVEYLYQKKIIMECSSHMN